MTPRQRSTVVELLRQLVTSATALSLYSAGHRTSTERSVRALALLTEVLEGVGTITLLVLNGELFLDGAPLEKEPCVEQFVRQALRHNIGHVTVSPGATEEDLDLLLGILARQAQPDLQGTPHLTFGSLEVDPTRAEAGDPRLTIASYSDIPPTLLKGLANSYAAPAREEQIDLAALLALVAGFVAAFRSEANPLLALVPLRQLDEQSFSRALDVCVLNLAQGMSLGIEGQLLHDLGVAGLLHDIGRLRLPPADVRGLDADDPELLTRHAVRGAELLLGVPGLPRLAATTAFEHHLRHDLSGYPKVPPGWRLGLCTEMTMISVRFDALRTGGGYGGADDFERAAGALLERAGTELHPALTLNFVRVLGKLGGGVGG